MTNNAHCSYCFSLLFYRFQKGLELLLLFPPLGESRAVGSQTERRSRGIAKHKAPAVERGGRQLCGMHATLPKATSADIYTNSGTRWAMEKLDRRLWWRAELRRLFQDGPECELRPERGCRRVFQRRSDGRTVRDFRLPDEVLIATPGERYLCLGPALDAAVQLEIVRASAAVIHARLLGEIGIVTGMVQLALLVPRDLPVIARAQARHLRDAPGAVS